MDAERQKTLFLILVNNGSYFMNNFQERKRQRKRRSCWVKEWFDRRISLSAHQTVLSKLRLNDVLDDTQEVREYTEY